MSQNYGIHGKSHTPGKVISKCRKRKVDEIIQQRLASDKHISWIQFYIFAQQRYDHAGNELYQPGRCRCDRHTGHSKFRRSKQSENKHCIQQNIQSECQHVQCHTNRHATDASKDRKVDFCHSPAEISNSHDPYVGRSDRDQFLIRSE